MDLNPFRISFYLNTPPSLPPDNLELWKLKQQWKNIVNMMAQRLNGYMGMEQINISRAEKKAIM